MNLPQESTLFKDITPAETEKLLTCLQGRTKKYRKNEFILLPGKTINSMGIILSGSVDIVEEDFWGNRTILSRVGSGEMFGEAYATCPDTPLLVGVVVAEEPCEVLLLTTSQLTTQCKLHCPMHGRLIQNLLTILARKNIMLTQKMSHLCQRSTRKKVLSYLSAMANRSGTASFTIPFNRQQLADYLSVDRSALSAELSSMAKDGIISFQKSEFTLHKEAIFL